MFLRHGIVGLIIVIIFQIAVIFRIQPLAQFYFPFIWFGYIFVLDAIVYKLKNKSLIHNHFKKFILMLFLSALVWWIFEIINLKVRNWQYVGTTTLNIWVSLIFRTVAFSTVLPAVWETFDLVKALHIFDHSHLKMHYKITKTFIFVMVVFGIIAFILPLWYPTFTFPLVWLSFFLILDPINYIHHERSIIGYLKDGKLKVPLSLMLAGLICGLFWEFWNYWAPMKWIYHIPYVGFFKIFEMPILGYLGYLFFSWELYAMYHFSLWILKTKKNVLFKNYKSTQD